MRKHVAFVAVALVVGALGASVAAQSPPRASAPPAVIVVPARDFGAIEGAKLYEAYCSSCHGVDGKGNGPAARALQPSPPDLTRIQATHTDTDCFRHVLAELRLGHRTSAEPKVSGRDLDMPNWGPIFYAMTMDPVVGSMRLQNVASHVVSIQAAK